MDLKQRISQAQAELERLASGIPGYPGYKDKERRRDADKLLRLELARKYDQQRQRLSDLQVRLIRTGQLEALDDLEQALMRLQRLSDRLKTASYGYAGWFDARMVEEDTLDQLYAFDSSLADGVSQVAQDIDLADKAWLARKGLDQAMAGLADTLEKLNTRLDQRQDLLSKGKKLPPAELLEVLERRPPPDQIEQDLARLHLHDAVTCEGTDYLLAGKVTYAAEGATWYAYLLQDGETQRWLRTGNFVLEQTGLYREITLAIEVPPPETIDYEGESLIQVGDGSARVTVEGAGGQRRGSVDYWSYSSLTGMFLQVEKWGDEIKVSYGRPVDLNQIEAWPRG